MHHWLYALVASAVLFTAAFVVLRLGLGWLDRLAAARESRESEALAMPIGPGWAERPPDRTTTLPPRMG